MSDKDLIVLILVPTTSDDPKRNGPTHGAIGTGCVVGPNLVLTSRHVLEADGRRNPEFPIRVRWCALHQRGDREGGWRDLDLNDEDVIFWPDDDLDAALLSCPHPPELARHSPYVLATALPKQPHKWGGRGFPVSHGQDECLYGDFVGEVMSCGSSDPTFSVSSELTTATCQEDWSGASGMPVIVGRTVLGIIKSVPDRLDNRELHAVPAARIRADPKLKAVLDTRTQRIGRAQELIVDALRQSDTAAKRLAHFLLPDCQEFPACPNTLARAALNTHLDELVDHALKAQTQLRSEGLASAADVVTQFVQAVLPKAADDHQADLVAASPPDLCSTVVRLDVHSPTMTEILMAAADHRPTSFRVVRVPTHYPLAEAMIGRLLEGGETGRDPEGVQRERDLIAGLLTLFESGIGDIEPLDQAFFLHLRKELTESASDPGPDDEIERKEFEDELAEEIDIQLRGLAIKQMPYAERFTHYLLVEVPTTMSSDRRIALDEMLQRINARFKQIAVICIEPEKGKTRRELNAFGNLRMLLYQEPNTDAP